MPPLTFIAIAPVLAPLQVVFVTVPIITLNVPGWVISCDKVAIHPLESVTVTVYVRADKFVMSCVVAPLLHANVYGCVPPLTFIAIAPVLAPLQVVFVTVPIVTFNVPG